MTGDMKAPLTMNSMKGRETFAVKNSPSKVCIEHERGISHVRVKKKLAIESTVTDSVGRGVSPDERVSGGADAARNVSDAILGTRAPMGSKVEKRLREGPPFPGGDRMASLTACGRERRDISLSHPSRKPMHICTQRPCTSQPSSQNAAYAVLGHDRSQSRLEHVSVRPCSF